MPFIEALGQFSFRVGKIVSKHNLFYSHFFVPVTYLSLSRITF